MSSVLFGYGTFICIHDSYYFVILYLYKWSLREKQFSVSFTFKSCNLLMQKSIKTALFKKKIFNLNILNEFFLSGCLPWNLYTSKYFIKKIDPLGHWKNGWILTPQWILMDPCIKQAPVLSKQFWIIPWPLAYHRLNCIRKRIESISDTFFGWKWWVISFHDYLGLSNACSYDVDDIIGRADRFGFQNFCIPDSDIRIFAVCHRFYFL